MPARLTHGSPLYLTSDIRRIEARHGHLPLMERAGHAAAKLARALAGDGGQPVLIFAGPGNNGGDAFVAARYLKQWFFAVTVVFAGEVHKLPADAAAAHRAWLAAGGATIDTPLRASTWSLVIDGLFGIGGGGIARPIEGRYADWIALINAHQSSGAPVLALDIPSGLNADTGAVHGSCVRATHTLTFIAAKPGLLTLDGPDHAGEIFVEDLALDTREDTAPGDVRGYVLGATSGLAPRRRNTHKGSHGSVGIIGGAHGMVGAALLAGRAALKLGAGRVYVGLLARDAPLLDAQQPELMLRDAGDVLKLDHLSCLAVGPGLGQSPEAAFYVRCALECAQARGLPLIIDADGLNLIARSAELKNQLKQIVTEILLTPHPAEAARLLACSTAQVQADRIAAATKLSVQFNCHVVLKGAGSVCASPGRPWRVNLSGNPGMAAAGMGDVLTGIIAALLAQGMPAQSAQLTQCALDNAVWLHGAAADACVASGLGPVGLTAGETIDAARRLYRASTDATVLHSPTAGAQHP